MVKVTIDGTELEVPAGFNVLQACEMAGKEIPRFCYHDRLSVAGNCRMCLVEIEKGPPKPVASCAMPVADGMVVKTDSEMVRRGRRGVMEFLLINHPLDCPICDQGGECDLQDQSVAYGRDHSRFEENKRAVKDKYLGPLVKTVMTRCIQCTRCVRFAQEIAGVPELGATFRGENVEIGTYVEKALTSELSGNLIDICPVGALTSKPYAFTARPWELNRTDSIDVMDAVGANIVLCARGPEVMRVLPRINEDVNEEWLADKSRFAVDGLRRRRLDTPWVRENGTLRQANWQEAFQAIASRMQGLDGARIGALIGDLADAESIVALKDLMASAGSSLIECRQDGAALDASRSDFFMFNSTIAGIEDADAILLIGTDPRHEAPVLNARIRKHWLATQLPIASFGAPLDLTYRVDWLGTDLSALSSGGFAFVETLCAAKKPMVIVGQGALARPDGAAILAASWALADQVGALNAGWHGFNVLHTAASRAGALMLGAVPPGGENGLPRLLDGGVDLLWLLGADEFDTARIGANTFVVYQGSHGDKGAARADVILPGAAYTEKDGTYVNTEGRVQQANRAVHPLKDAKDDWRIVRAFSAVIGRPLPYDTIEAVRARLIEVNPAFAVIDDLPVRGCTDPAGPSAHGTISAVPVAYAISSYWQTDPVSRASPTMAECVRVHETAQAALPSAAE
ncbi:NADH-quinone oxidoreductase subunit NuoG [Granulibacter bethesdensis]|uniref:NADH-quinone oxidoreductase subunit NuoG n=1 Tax=Granulibacter bethesdensis TaxID=364410 RepID=UPI0003F208DA|nr:NADH-quinone oxidoreductase subunit NuoG [Granulibacter bethesdensis]AHJ66265.1 NADH-quinone oxidoreductase chain G [Granulibacter bethesdensis CGDNIH4]